MFYLNEQEFFPKIQSNEKINFITLNFTGLGTNVLKITGSEYLSNLDEITPIENKTYETLDDSDFLPPSGEFDQTSSNDYLIWLIVGSIVIIIVIIVVSKFLKNKN